MPQKWFDLHPLAGVKLPVIQADDLADAPRSRTSLTSYVFGREQIASHAVSDARYRFIRYGNDFEELYDLETDPDEFTNRAADPALAEVKARLALALPANPAANRGKPANSTK